MSSPVRRTSVGRGGSGIGYSDEFLKLLAHILVRSGHSPRKLAREFRDICAALKEPAELWNPAQLNHLADIPHVIAYWHADPEFVDTRGRPAPLALTGRQRSLSTLIARVLPAEDPQDVVASLLRVRGIRRRGRMFLPTGRQLVLERANARVHGLGALLGMLRTIDHNVSHAPEFGFFERVAINPHFPQRALTAFHREFKQRAGAFLWRADDTMRRREVRRGSEATTRLGVGIFTFEDPVITGRAGIAKGRSQGGRPTSRPRPPKRAGRKARP